MKIVDIESIVTEENKKTFLEFVRASVGRLTLIQINPMDSYNLVGDLVDAIEKNGDRFSVAASAKGSLDKMSCPSAAECSETFHDWKQMKADLVSQVVLNELLDVALKRWSRDNVPMS